MKEVRELGGGVTGMLDHVSLGRPHLGGSDPSVTSTSAQSQRFPRIAGIGPAVRELYPFSLLTLSFLLLLDGYQRSCLACRRESLNGGLITGQKKKGQIKCRRKGTDFLLRSLLQQAKYRNFFPLPRLTSTTNRDRSRSGAESDK